MSNKNEIPEVDIVVDHEAGVIREVKPQQTRSKKGHERRVNAGIYTVLILMSIIWLAPFVFLVFQSFKFLVFLFEASSGETTIVLFSILWCILCVKLFFCFLRLNHSKLFLRIEIFIFEVEITLQMLLR